MRAYLSRFYATVSVHADVVVRHAADVVNPDVLPVGVAPGFTLTEVIDQFYLEGVVPDLLPADLGQDDITEVDADGSFTVDPISDIRTDPFEMRENRLMDSVPVAAEPLPEAPIPNADEAPLVPEKNGTKKT